MSDMSIECVVMAGGWHSMARRRKDATELERRGVLVLQIVGIPHEGGLTVGDREGIQRAQLNKIRVAHSLGGRMRMYMNGAKVEPDLARHFEAADALGMTIHIVNIQDFLGKP